jgi:hypothetical protein
MQKSPKARFQLVRDNIQPVLCIIVMASDDMETRHGVELRIYFTLRLLEVRARADRTKETFGSIHWHHLAKRARMHDSLKQQFTLVLG